MMKISKQSFTISTSELEGRLDPIYYSGAIYGFMQKLNFDLVKIKDIAKSINSGIGAGKQDQSDKKNGILQIRPTNLNRDGQLKFDKNIYIPKSHKLKILKKDNVLFNNTNSQELVGKTAFFDIDDDMTFSNHMTRIDVNKNIIEAKYLYLILNVYQENKIFYNLCTNWNNQSGVGVSLLKNLKIPLPPKEIQTKIIQIMDNVYKIKKEKEEKAKSLLDSIDTYLLKKLDITLPKEEKVVSFEVSSSDVFGGRFDPLKYNKNYINKHIEIEKSRYKTTKLKDLVINSSGGNWGDDEKKIDNFKNYQECLVIRSTEFDNQQNLNINTKRRVFRFIKKSSLKNLKIKENDILIEKSGGSPNQPVGRVAILTKSILRENSICYSNFIHKISLIEDVNAHYIFNFLKTIHNCKVTENMQSQTNGIRNLIMKEFLSIKIPLPPLNIQNEIASHIQALRDEAKQLKQEAKEILKKAKDEVEGIVL